VRAAVGRPKAVPAKFSLLWKRKIAARIGYTDSHYTALCRQGKQKNQEKTPARKQAVL